MATFESLAFWFLPWFLPKLATYLEVSKFLASPEVDRFRLETLLVKVKRPPGARGRHAALALQRPRLVRPQLGVERGVDAAHWKGRTD